DYRRRLCWSFKWVSSGGNEFNYDYRVSFRPEEQDEQVYNYGTISPGRADREGMSVFYQDQAGEIFATYSAYAHGIDMLNAAYNYLDLVPKGRDEEGPWAQFWVRRRDEHESDGGVGY